MVAFGRCRYNGAMPSYRTAAVFKLWRGVKARLRFEAELTRSADERQEPGSGGDEYGLDLTSGDRHYRAWVGFPDEYDTIAALQVSLLLAAGLRETHKLADVGCGSLRAGRMLIPYLRPGGYHGIEPEKWLVEDGLERELGRDVMRVKEPKFRFVSDFSLEGFGEKFDFIVAQSVFSHTHEDLLNLGFGKIAQSLAPGGKFLATWAEGPSQRKGEGWIHKGVRRYTWEQMEQALGSCGLVARRLPWPHPRQSWFAAAHPESLPEIEALVDELHTPREGWGKERHLGQPTNKKSRG